MALCHRRRAFLTEIPVRFMLPPAFDPHPRGAFLSCRSSTGTADEALSKRAQHLIEPSAEATSRPRALVERRRRPDRDGRNERRQLVDGTKRTGSKVVTGHYLISWIRPSARGNHTRASAEAPSIRAGCDPGASGGSARSRSEHSCKVGSGANGFRSANSEDGWRQSSGSPDTLGRRAKAQHGRRASENDRGVMCLRPHFWCPHVGRTTRAGLASASPRGHAFAYGDSYGRCSWKCQSPS